ncbi:TlpA family protein disulfide reductase [Seonamhaeicola sp. MEBiC1930]|uniref:TlpA family protein disulfide reductase n=1 Tax=Seonamhaeicola sp. MEBiC01930 TaxID=2976768 RepID=UPI003250EDBD
MNNAILRSAFIIFVLAQLVSCKSEKNKKDVVFSLQGKVSEIYPGDILLYKVSDLNSKKYEVVDTLTVQNDSTFIANYNLEPHFYILSVYDSIRVPFIADSLQNISINFLPNRKFKVSGSPDTELFEDYEKFRKEILQKTVYPLRGRFYPLLRKNDPKDKDLIEELRTQMVQAEENYRDTLIHAVKKMGTSIAIYPTMLRWNGDKDITFYEKLTTDFAKEHLGLEVTNTILEKIRVMKQVSIGGKIPEIIANDVSGTEQTLYKNLSKYTLVDFWGSWCGPCRAESDELVMLHEKYQDSGFVIFGYAVENSEENWKNAIVKDLRKWINVSTLNGYSNEICSNYGITSLPKNFLVDNNGIIIAKDIHGIELEEILANLLQ